METIYKIKVRSDQNISASYPSERRYSASKVLGLTIIYVALASFALLFASIIFVIISNNCVQNNNNSNNIIDNATVNYNYYMRNDTYRNDLDNLRFVSNVIVASILLFIGTLISSIAGFMAWKKWYIDANIKWFFMTSCVTVLLTSISTILLTWTIVILHYYDYLHKEITQSFIPFYHITINIYIASILATIWSIISIKISFNGMNNPYRDDYDINTARKLNDNWKKTNMPPDIINNFATSQNVAKYLPKIDNVEKDDEKVTYYVDTNSEPSTVCEKNIPKSN